MRNLFLIFALILGVLVSADAQDFKIEIKGYVGVNASVNSRSSVEARNRHIYLYPLPEDLTETGEDQNDESRFDLDASYSRFGLHVGGPELKGFNTSAVIEGDFLGNGNGDNNFRLRHAFVKLAKEKWALTVGQTWHPFFLVENYPHTVNVNAGTPFHPLLRSPQVNIAWQASEHTQLLFFIIEQNNFRNSGFESNGTERALMPELDAQVKWVGKGVWAAMTAGYKTLAIPELISESASVEKVSSFHVNGSFRYTFPGITFRMGGIYGGNITEMVMLGGVGRSVVDGDYVPLQTASLWGDIHGNNTDGFQPGIFAGYTANMGSPDEVTVVGDLSRSNGLVASVFAVSPRLKYFMGNACIGAEWLVTSADWGTGFDSYGVPDDTENYINHRLLLSLRYIF
jgi:hypothetical protein